MSPSHVIFLWLAYYHLEADEEKNILETKLLTFLRCLRMLFN